MLKIPIMSIGKTFSIKHIDNGSCDFDFDNTNIISYDNVVQNRKKKQFFKKTTLLSMFAIRDALKHANIDMNTLDKNRVGLYTFEKESNHFCIEDTYKKLIKLCHSRKVSKNTFSDSITQCYSLSDIFRLMPNLSNHLISSELGINGSNKTLLTGEGADLQSIIDAGNDIFSNKYDMILCGSSVLGYSALEKKQMSLFYNYVIDEKELVDYAVYVVLGKQTDSASMYFRGGRSFYIKKSFNNDQIEKYLHNIFDSFYKSNNIAKEEVDLILYVDQYIHKSTYVEIEILKNEFINSKIVMPGNYSYNGINNGLFYLSLLYNNVYSFKNALLIQKNHNGIITFINITK